MKINGYIKLLIGVLAGAATGYSYHIYVGCAGGTCALNSSPIYSTLYGALVGLLHTAPTPNHSNAPNQGQSHER
ncbi:MAG: DUF6132 family protein [Chitinophagales bacterium]|nr:DUF6132 family protein [Chitinophagales bacterium]MDW8419217.1 DUF6132 family protein [Chitinophagales bacterium]